MIRKIIIVLFGMVAGITAMAQETPDTIFFDSMGWKIERYYASSEEYCEKCYTNDGKDLCWQGYVNDGQYVGTWCYYDKGCLMMKASNFSYEPIAPPVPVKGILSVPISCYVEKYYPNGQKSCEGTCLFFDSPEEDAYEIGQWIYYNTDGSILRKKEIEVPCIQDLGLDTITCGSHTFTGKVLFRNAQDQCMEAIESNDSICIVSADKSFFDTSARSALFVGMTMSEFRQEIDFCMPKTYSVIFFVHPSSITDYSHEDLKTQCDIVQSLRFVYVTIVDEKISELNSFFNTPQK